MTTRKAFAACFVLFAFGLLWSVGCIDCAVVGVA
jgi:hypothetical protein